MFSQETLEKIPEPLVKIFKDLERDVIEDILKRMRIVPEIIPSSDYQMWRLNQLGSHKVYVNRILRKALRLSYKEISKIYNDTISSGYARDEEIYKRVGAEFIPLNENESLKQLIGAVKEQTKGDFNNITKTLGFVIDDEGVSNSEYFNRVLNKAEFELMTGSRDYGSIINKSIAEMVNSGVRYIDYASGHKDRIDVAVRRAVMTGVHQVTGKISEDNAKALGTDKFEVSAHATARPTHQEWQGKVYTYQELIDVCGLGTVTGLCGVNCYHTYDPFIEGISVRKYTDAELKKMNDEANKVKSYNGKDYTTYEATQYQRVLERNMRALKERIDYLKQYGGSKDDINTLKSRYNTYLERYNDFSIKMGLPFQPERIHTGAKIMVGNSADMEKELITVYRTYKEDKNLTRNSITN